MSDTTTSKLKILIIPYSHSDWAWTYTRGWHEERYALAFSEVLDILNERPEYRWHFDTENEQLMPFRARCPERMEELKRRVREGKVGISGGTVSNPHPHRIGGETFVRNMVLGRRYFERTFPGADLSVLSLNDVIAGYTQLPQLIRKAGYRYYRFWRPEAGMDEQGLPRTFHWEGLDGTVLLCSRGSYGGLNSKGWVKESWEETFRQVIESEILPRAKLDPAHVICVFRGSDDVRPLRTHREEPLPLFDLIEEWNARDMGEMRFATPAEYFSELEKEADALPTVRGTLDVTGWTYWYGQIGNESLREWRVRDDIALVCAEMLSEIGRALEIPSPASDLEALWWDLLRTCPHATLWLFEEDYRELLNRAKQVHADAERISRNVLNRLVDRIAPTSEGRPLLVFNPLSWTRTDVVSVHLAFPMRGTRSLEVRDSARRIVPHQAAVEPYEDGTIKEADLWFSAESPSLGYGTFYILDGKEGASESSRHGDASRMENDQLRLSFVDGRLVSIFDKETEVEHVAREEGDANALRYYAIEDTGPYHYGPVTDVVGMIADDVQLVADGPVFSTVRTVGRVGDHRAVQDVTLHHTLKRIDLRTEIECSGGDGFFRVHFPLAYEGTLKAHVPFGVEERDVTQVPYGSLERLRENVFYASEWVDYANDDCGIALVGALGVQGFHFDPERRTLSHTLLKAIRHPEQGWERFETRLREAKGVQEFHYALIPHRGDWRTGDVFRAAAAFHRPTTAIPRTRWARDGDLPEERSFLRIEPKHVLLSAWYEDDGQSLLRVYEAVGEEGTVTATVPFDIEEAVEADLRGVPMPEGKRIEVEGNALSFSIRRWEIVTIGMRSG